MGRIQNPNLNSLDRTLSFQIAHKLILVKDTFFYIVVCVESWPQWDDAANSTFWRISFHTFFCLLKSHVFSTALGVFRLEIIVMCHLTFHSLRNNKKFKPISISSSGISHPSLTRKWWSSFEWILAVSATFLLRCIDNDDTDLAKYWPQT